MEGLESSYIMALNKLPEKPTTKYKYYIIPIHYFEGREIQMILLTFEWSDNCWEFISYD